MAAAEKAAEKEAPVESAGAAAKAKPPILMILLVVINMAVVLGVGFMLHLNRKKEAAQPNIDDVIKGEHEAQEEKPEEDFVGKMVPLETFLVNLNGSRGKKLLKINMELEVEGEKIFEEIEKRKPQMRDIIIILLSSKTYTQVADKEGKDRLRDEIRDTVNAFLTKGKIKRVLFTEFIYN